MNDSAERNVKLLQDFIRFSNDEELRQDLFLSIEYKRNDIRKKKQTESGVK